MNCKEGDITRVEYTDPEVFSRSRKAYSILSDSLYKSESDPEYRIEENTVEYDDGSADSSFTLIFNKVGALFMDCKSVSDVFKMSDAVKFSADDERNSYINFSFKDIKKSIEV